MGGPVRPAHSHTALTINCYNEFTDEKNMNKIVLHHFLQRDSFTNKWDGYQYSIIYVHSIKLLSWKGLKRGQMNGQNILWGISWCYFCVCRLGANQPGPDKMYVTERYTSDILYEKVSFVLLMLDSPTTSESSGPSIQCQCLLWT